jgi:DNA-binding SARP family transcriptional activator
MAVELALHGVANGRAEGRRFALWLCEHWGAPARAALLEWRNDATLGAACRDVLTHTPLPPDERVEVAVLGQTALRIDGYPSVDPDWRRERVRALLVWLIIRRQGTREQVAGALWPDLSSDKAGRNLRTTLNYLHGVLEPSRPRGQAPWFVRLDGVELGLDGSLDVDMWRFNELLDQADTEQRNGHATRALPLLLAAVQLYGGELTPDLEYEWLDLERIHLRSRFVRAGCRAAELLVALNRSSEAVDVARRALAADPWHEPSYTVLAAAYDSLGDATSARRVLERSAAQLAEL